MRVGRRFFPHPLVLVVMAAFASGCLPIAWVSPPMQLEAGVGVVSSGTGSGEQSVDVDETRAGQRSTDLGIPLRVSLHPLQLFPSQLGRAFDLGAGYQVMPISSRPAIHGPVLEVGYLHSPELPDDPERLSGELDYTRVGVHLKAHGLFGTRPGLAAGPAGTLQVSFEWFGFKNTDFSGCSYDDDEDDFDDPYWDDPYWDDEDDDEDDESVVCGSGFAYGETSGGFFVEGSYGQFDHVDHWWVGAGIKVRVPASIGLGFIVGDF